MLRTPERAALEGKSPTPLIRDSKNFCKMKMPSIWPLSWGEPPLVQRGQEDKEEGAVRV